MATKFDNTPNRRELILEKTLEAVAEHGIGNITYRKIAACAGVPLGSLTYYFSGLEVLLEEAFTRFTLAMSAQYQAGFEGVDSAEQACDAITALIAGGQITTARNQALMYQLYAFASCRPALTSIMQRWMCRSQQTLEQWFGPVVTSSEKMSTTVNTLTSDVDASIDFVLEGHQHTCEVLSQPHNRYAMAQAVSLLAQARQVAIFGIGASGILAEYTARLFSRMGLPAMPLNRTGIGLAEQLIALQRGDVLVMMAQKSAHREGQTTLREAKRLGIPTILLTNALDSRFSKEASVVIHVPRGGEKGKIPLHGTVLLCLEMIILSVASTEPQRTIKSMKRINEFHRGLKPGKKSG